MSIKIEPFRRRELEYYGVTIPPTQDELPYDDGIPMETPRHAAQMRLLIESLELHWSDRQDFFVGGNMFVYFSLRQVRNQDFRGSDFFVVLGVPRKERKSWVVWEEEKAPNLVIEMISESTATRDKVEKKQIYQDQLRVPEYIWFDPFTAELAGFTTHNGSYESMESDDQGRLISEQIGLALTLWDGTYQSITTRWLRWETPEGILLPTAQEVAEQERQRANRLAERLRAMGLDPDQVE
jgi:Uma2 family endonuclease